jgi:hypothetical protein
MTADAPSNLLLASRVSELRHELIIVGFNNTPESATATALRLVVGLCKFSPLIFSRRGIGRHVFLCI